MQTNSLYVASLEPSAGKLLVTMGLMELLSRNMGKIGFFRPVIDPRQGRDQDISLILSRYCPNMAYEESFGFTAEEVKNFVAEDNIKFFFEDLTKKFENLKSRHARTWKCLLSL